MTFLILISMLLTPPQWLVLTNGKSLQVDRFERSGSQVMIHQKDQVFSIPQQLVDWEATQKRNALEEQARRKEREAREAPAEPEPPRKPIVLVDDGLRREAPPKKARVPYRTLGNSIIVSVSMNGSGPFDVLLDTGASMTLIHPDVIAQIRAKTSGDTIPLTGLGGDVRAQRAVLDSVSLGGVRVDQFSVAAHQLPSLTAMGVVGLLGQDFLNHFVVELDSSTKQLTLTPHGMGGDMPEHADLADRATEMLERHGANTRKLSDAFRRIGAISQAYFRRRPGESIAGTAQELSSLSQTISQIRTFNHEARSLLSKIVDENLIQDRQAAMRYQNCYALYDRFLQEAQSLCQVLRRGLSRDAGDAEMDATVREKYQRVEERYREYLTCIQ